MPQRFQVVVTDTLPEIGSECRILDDVADVRLLQTYDEADVARLGSDADVLLVYHTIKITEKTIATLHKCKGIIRCGVGYDNVDIHAAGSRGIVVCNVPDYGTEEVADHALLMLLAIVRRFLPSQQSVSAGNWNYTIAIDTPRLRGRTLGIIGCGRIGTAMALRAKAVGLRVVIFDPYKPDGLEKALGVERVHRLDDLLRQSHIVSVHCPLTPETRHILNARTLSQLPRGAYVVNTARGPCVDANGLLEALESGQVAYAALDVVEVEPLNDERLRQHPRIVLTPHTAFYSIEGYQEMRSKGAEEARRIALGEKVRNPVNLHVLKDARCNV
ncbi:MAG: C-terminal binding protein [Planctomycetes bacterium]|nr:C-terminal binding protein [Planctomycetota bacterium]